MGYYNEMVPAEVAVSRKFMKYRRRVLNQVPSISKPIKLAKIIGHLVGIGSIGYMVLVMDFGPNEHAFSSIRRGFERWRNDFFSLSEEEKVVYKK
ncbi:hypothetical protein HDV01_002294 [Terramyces sp. JEL0728]|nr:hypothetical protein HDV01_002294 [Terramyces sp. JEL0728]